MLNLSCVTFYHLVDNLLIMLGTKKQEVGQGETGDKMFGS